MGVEKVLELVETLESEPCNVVVSNEGNITPEDIVGDWELLYTTSATMRFNKGLSGLVPPGGREDLRDGRGVTDHATCPHDLGQVTARHDRRRLVVDAALESRGAPVNELDGALGLDRRDRRVHVLGDDVATVHHATSHVLAMTGITLHEHRRRLEDAHGDFRDRKLFVVGLLGGDDGR